MTKLGKVKIPKQVSKKRRIYEVLLGEIKSKRMPLGARVPSASVLAEQFSVSYVTMHAALNELTRDGWLVRHPKNGTFVAEPPAKETERKTITFVLPVRNEIVASGNSTKVFEIMSGVSQRAEELQLAINIRSLPSYPSREESSRYLETIEEQAGVIFIGSQYEFLIESLLQQKRPLVVVDGKDMEVDGVSYSREVAIRRAVEQFVRNGRRNIGYFGVIPDKQGKVDAFRRSLAEHGLPVDPRLFWNNPNPGPVEENARAFLAQKLPCDAIFIEETGIALAFHQTAQALGIRIPEDLAIITLGSEAGLSGPGTLSYLRIPYFEFGETAVSLLSERLNDPGPEAPRKIMLEAEYIPGASCP